MAVKREGFIELGGYGAVLGLGLHDEAGVAVKGVLVQGLDRPDTVVLGDGLLHGIPALD